MSIFTAAALAESSPPKHSRATAHLQLPSQSQWQRLARKQMDPDEHKRLVGECPDGFHWSTKRSHCIPMRRTLQSQPAVVKYLHQHGPHWLRSAMDYHAGLPPGKSKSPAVYQSEEPDTLGKLSRRAVPDTIKKTVPHPIRKAFGYAWDLATEPVRKTYNLATSSKFRREWIGRYAHLLSSAGKDTLKSGRIAAKVLARQQVSVQEKQHLMHSMVQMGKLALMAGTTPALAGAAHLGLNAVKAHLGGDGGDSSELTHHALEYGIDLLKSYVIPESMEVSRALVDHMLRKVTGKYLGLHRAQGLYPDAYYEEPHRGGEVVEESAGRTSKTAAHAALIQLFSAVTHHLRRQQPTDDDLCHAYVKAGITPERIKEHLAAVKDAKKQQRTESYAGSATAPYRPNSIKVFKNSTSQEWEKVFRKHPDDARALYSEKTGDMHAWDGYEATHDEVKEGGVRGLYPTDGQHHLFIRRKDDAPHNPVIRGTNGTSRRRLLRLHKTIRAKNPSVEIGDEAGDFSGVGESTRSGSVGGFSANGWGAPIIRPRFSSAAQVRRKRKGVFAAAAIGETFHSEVEYGDGGNKVSVFKNPNGKEWKEIFKDHPAHGRALLHHSGDLYAWDGYGATHNKVQDETGIYGHHLYVSRKSKSTTPQVTGTYNMHLPPEHAGKVFGRMKKKNPFVEIHPDALAELGVGLHRHLAQHKSDDKQLKLFHAAAESAIDDTMSL